MLVNSKTILSLPNSPSNQPFEKATENTKAFTFSQIPPAFPSLLPNNCNLGQHYHATRTNNCTLQNNSCIYVVALSTVLIKTHRSGLDPYYHTFLLNPNSGACKHMLPMRSQFPPEVIIVCFPSEISSRRTYRTIQG